MIRWSIFFLWIWGFGVMFAGLAMLTDLAFTRDFRGLPKRLLLVAAWPFMLLTARGRSRLFEAMSSTQR